MAQTSNTPKSSHRGHLLKHEPRIGGFGGGQTKRKYWFALSEESPFLYWYKAKNDMSPVGKVSLSGAAFTFDPRTQGVFEIHCGKDICVLEAANNQFRMEWLNKLQDTRRKIYSTSLSNKATKPPEKIADNKSTDLLIDLSEDNRENSDKMQNEPFLTENSTELAPVLDNCSSEISDRPTNDDSSQFYLTREGQLNEKSFEIPAETSLISGVTGSPILGTKIASDSEYNRFNNQQEAGDRDQNEIDWDQTIKYRIQSMDKQKHDEMNGLFGAACSKRHGDTNIAHVRDSRSKSLLIQNQSGDVSLGTPSSHDRKNKFFSNLMGIKLPALKTKQKSNCDGCQEFLSVIETLKERVCDTEDEITAQKDVIHSLRLSLSSAKNQIEALKQISHIQDLPGRITYILERENQLTHLQVETTEQKLTIQDLTERNRELEDECLRSQGDLEAYKDSLRSKEELILKLVENADIDTDKHTKLNRENILDLGVDVALSVDGRESTSVCSGARLSFLSTSETEVKDISEMGDLQVSLRAYEQQNAFLNKEILDLQAMIRGLENREKDLIRKNFDLEAMFYQLKSKYLLLLNHFKPSKAGITETEIEHLIDDATRWSGIAASNPEGLDQSGEHGERRKRSEKEQAEITDKLGFFLAEKGNNSPWHVLGEKEDRIPTAKDLLAIAAQYNKKSDDIVMQMFQESSNEHIDWLTKWDSFLVNLTNQKYLNPSPELKALIRTGVPHTYRGRVWKNLVNYRVKDTVMELGNGYYESLLKKSLSRRETSFDALLKQIDLDLARTLPGNKLFTDPDSGKMDELRRVLYAYRWHNPNVGYCQGLNRLAAVALLYLDESDAFWFLIACVEHLQPDDYYTSTLITALADQRVLTDLVNDKLPKVAAILRQHETDLTMFTLSWFLTCFVDSLSHKVYFEIFDVFLYEGNKVLFRFALACLKMCESQIISCKSAGSLHSCISRIGESVTDYRRLANIGFNELNPFPMKYIETRRNFHLSQLNAELTK